MFNALEILGSVASKGIVESHDVMKSINKFVELIDYEKLDYLVN